MHKLDISDHDTETNLIDNFQMQKLIQQFINMEIQIPKPLQFREIQFTSLQIINYKPSTERKREYF